MYRYTLGLGVVFLIVAVVTGLFGYGVVSTGSWEHAKVFFVVFLVLSVLAFIGGLLTRSRSS